jgi:hypothetical protein
MVFKYPTLNEGFLYLNMDIKGKETKKSVLPGMWNQGRLW